MAVAHDAFSEFPTGTTADTSGDLSWTHTPSGTPAGVLVFVVNLDSSTPVVDSVDYGGVDVPAVTGGAAADTAGEIGRCTAYFLGSGVPSGAQTVGVRRSSGTAGLWAGAVTVTAGGNTAVHEPGIVLLQNDGTLAVQSVTDGSPGTNSVRYAAGMTGLAAPPSAGTGSTLLGSIDAGAQGGAIVRETTAGQGARNVGFTSGTSDDRAFVHLAVKELPTPTTTSVARLSLESLGTPDTATDHTLHVRARRNTVTTAKIRMALYEGATNRSGDLESAALTGSLADYDLPIADADAANITDYSNLEVRLWAYDVNGTTGTVEVAEVWLTVPEGSGPTAAVVPLGTAAASSSATLALRAQTRVTLQTSAAQSAATLALRAPTKVPLGTTTAQSSATLALSVPATVPLGTAAAQSAGTLTVTAATRVPLGASAAQSSATLALTAPTTVPLGSSAAQSSATLALTAQTRIALGTSAGQSSATLALTAPTIGAAVIPLQTAAAVSTATLAVTAKTTVPLQASAAQSTASLALTAPTKVALQASPATSSASLSLTAPTKVSLGTAAAQSTATLALTAPMRVALGTSAAQSTASLGLTAKTAIPLGSSTAVSSTSIVLVAGVGVIPLATAAVTSNATLALSAKTTVTLQPSAATASPTLTLRAPTRVLIGSSTASSTTSLAVTAPTVAFLPLDLSVATATGTLDLSTVAPPPLGHVDSTTSVSSSVDGSTAASTVEAAATGTSVEGSMVAVGLVD